MKSRLVRLGYGLLVIGLVFMIAGVVTYTKVQDGYDSLHAFSAAQNVTLSYNDDGQLVDRGETAGADAIMSLLVDDWKYPVVKGDLDPNDPLVNTGTEYMYQMATITYHTLHGTQNVVLDEDTTYDGVDYPAGTPIEFAVDGRYWTGFDRSIPVEAAAREMAWSGTAHALVGELGVGAVTHSTLQMGLGLAGLFAGLGLTFFLIGADLVWAMRASGNDLNIPDRVPDALLADTKVS